MCIIYENSKSGMFRKSQLINDPIHSINNEISCLISKYIYSCPGPPLDTLWTHHILISSIITAVPVQYKTAKHLTQKPNIYSTKPLNYYPLFSLSLSLKCKPTLKNTARQNHGHKTQPLEKKTRPIAFTYIIVTVNLLTRR